MNARSVLHRDSQGWVLALLCLTQFIVVLDFSIVNVALPGMQRDLGLAPSTLQWVITAYSLTFGGCLLLGGRASDLFGRRRFLLGGLVWFAAASFLGGVAPNALALIGARALQGLGAALLAPTSLSLATTTFAEGPARHRALGAMGAVASSGFAAGAIVGGVLTATLGWRWVLFVNVPLGIAAVLMTLRWLPAETTLGGTRQLDIWGAVTSTTGLVVLAYTLANGTTMGWLALPTLGTGTAAVALLGAFVSIERHVPDPLVPFSLLRSRVRVGANLVAMLAPGAFGSLIFILTLFLQEVQHVSPLLTGIAFLPLAGMLLVGTNLIVRRVQQVGVVVPLLGGSLVLALGLLLLAVPLTAHARYPLLLFPALLIIGAGVSAIFGTMIIAGTSGVPNTEQGIASGLLSTAQQVGAGLGLALVSAIIAASVTHQPSSDGLTAGLRGGLFLCAGFALLGALVVYRVMRPAAPAPRATGAVPR